MLVVPGVDDIFDWERRLTRETVAMVGGQIVHFRDLFVEVLKAAGESRSPLATELQRLALVRQAIREEHPEIARVLPNQPGLAKAVLDLIDDFQTEMLDPDTVSSRANEAGIRHLEPYARVFRAYLRMLGEGRLTDAAGEAGLAIGKINRSWPERPVMFAGFDEMTGQQLEAVRRLAFEVGVDVTAAVTFEPDNPAMNLTATLVSDLESLGPEDLITRIETDRPDDLPHAGNLLKLQRGFLDKESAKSVVAKDDWEAFTVLRSAGRRNEAESINGEVARLVAGDGTNEPVPPGEIAIAVEQPAVNGTIIRDVLADFRIPASLESETPAYATVTGKAVLQFLAATRESGSAAELISYLRAPGGPPADEVDELELECRIGDVKLASKALARFKGRLPGPLAEDPDRDPAQLAADVAAQVSRSILDSDQSAVPKSTTVVEVRTAEAIAAAVREIREIEAEPDRSLALTEAIQSGLVKTWVVPDQGTVRISSPYSLRAKRFSHLLFAGLQEAPIADTDRVGPFLSADDLSSLGMSSRRDPEDQQRYLFYSCLTVPTSGLCLSCRIAEETGSPEHPSPLIEATESLFTREEEADGTEHSDEEEKPALIRRGGRLGSDSVFRPAEAPTEAELARSLRGARVAETSVPGLDAEVAVEIDRRQESAELSAARNQGMGDLSERLVARWAEDPVFSATELESYSRCQYGWFIERQVGPQRFGPEPDHFAFGTLVHGVLEKLFTESPDEMPGKGKIPKGWPEKIPGLVKEVSENKRVRLDTDTITHAAARKMAELRIRLFLERQR
ncbi:MAG: PD-(D/E)XK nuclease family protein, partial [Solirubrobacterales bacterium]|nr:PD-(D/E)XK nuclease family protein [Solirubrobacterales bacterium]